LQSHQILLDQPSNELAERTGVQAQLVCCELSEVLCDSDGCWLQTRKTIRKAQANFRYFPKYSNSVNAARRTWSKAGSGWTHDLVAYGLDLFHRRHLRTPTVRELQNGIDELPSHATIRRIYGNASNMLTHHGYLTRSPGAQPGSRCTLQRDRRGLFLPRKSSVENRSR